MTSFDDNLSFYYIKISGIISFPVEVSQSQDIARDIYLACLHCLAGLCAMMLD